MMVQHRGQLSDRRALKDCFGVDLQSVELFCNW